MSGESTPHEGATHEALERVFGGRTRCSTCAEDIEGYRVVTLFLHDHAIVRAYCPGCYPDAIEGEYGARGEWIVLDFDAFVERFGCPGPRPRATPVDRALMAVVRDPELTGLSPASECYARRRGPAPYRFTASYGCEELEVTASFVLSDAGAVLEVDAVDAGRRRLGRALGMTERG